MIGLDGRRIRCKYEFDQRTNERSRGTVRTVSRSSDEISYTYLVRRLAQPGPKKPRSDAHRV